MTNVRTKLEELNLVDRFLFDETMESREAYQATVSILLENEVELLGYPETEKEFRVSPELRQIRLDVIGMDHEKTLYYTEMQKKNTGNLRRRSRYYQAQLDVSLLEPGNKDFNLLNDSCFILIAPFDLFGRELYRYTFEGVCRECPDLKIEDGAVRVFINTMGRNREAFSQEFLDFMEYITASTDKAVEKTESSRIKLIHERVRKIRASEKMGVKYMQRWEEVEYARDEGREEGMTQGREEGRTEGREEGRLEGLAEGANRKMIQMVCKKLGKGKSPAEIAEELEEDMELVEKICIAAEKYAPEFNCDKIYSSVYGDEWEHPHQRRVRYKGTHPRKYSEKYKELNPDQYQDTVERVIQKGSTPAGMHLPICVREILDFLQIQPGMVGLDATLGYGGHSREMLKCLAGKGHLYGLDVDPIEIKKTEKRLRDLGYGEELLTILHLNFAELDQVAELYGPFQFLLADLGVSSMQIDNPDRGFSYKNEGPLDLRLNPDSGISAAERLREVTKDELAGMLRDNADEPYAEELAKAITTELRKGKKIETTKDLREVIAQTLAFLPEKERKEAVKKSCARVFQALRIDVNSEYEALDAFLQKLPDAMAPGGRIAILTFHSGEDRLVKKSFKELKKAGVYREIASDVIRPSAQECARNSRARSTKMRWAIKA